MIDALLATLERDAENELARLAEEGRTRAAAIAAASARRQAELRQAALGAKEAAGRERVSRRLTAARQSALGRVLAARAAFMERLFRALRAALPTTASSAAYRNRLAAELPRVLAFTAGADAVIRCAPNLQTTLRRFVRANGRQRVEPDGAIAAGYRVETSDGRLTIDATLESQLEAQRMTLAQAALAALEPR